MAVHADDVRAVAALARLGVAPERLQALAIELSGILEHMAQLSAVENSDASLASTWMEGMPLRPDVGVPLPLVGVREGLAPAMRDGFFVVPRLDSHDDADSAA